MPQKSKNPELRVRQFDKGLEIIMRAHSPQEVAQVWQIKHNIDLDLDKQGEVLKITIWVFKEL